MSEFNPDVPNTNDPDWMRQSRGTEGDQSMGTLFKGIGETIGGLAKTGDNYLQNKITVDARDSAERINQELNLDTSTVPLAITQSQGDLTRLAMAQSQGKITEEYYYARLANTMRGLRQRYPGYEKEVDAAMQQATGINPANAFRNALLQNIQKVQTANANSADKKDTFLRSHGEWMNADEIQDWQTTGGQKYGGQDGLITNILKRQSSEKQSQIAVEHAKNNQWDAKNTFSDQIGQMASSTMGDMMKASGLNGQGILGKLQEATKNGGAGIPDDQIASLVAFVGQQKANLQAKMNQYGTQYQNVPVSERQKEIEASLKQFDDLSNLIQQKQFGEAANLVLRNQATVDRTTSEIYKIPGMAGAAALSKIAPDTAQTVANDILSAQPGGPTTAMQNITVSDGVRGVINGSVKSNDVVNGIVNSNNDPKVKSAMLASYIDKLTGVAGSVKTSPEEMRTFVSNTYGVNADGDKLWNTVLPEDRLLLFNKLFSPGVTQAIINSGDKSSLQTYMAAAAERFTAIPSFKQAASTLASDLADSRYMRARLNPKTNQIELQYDQLGAQQAGKVVQMSQMLTNSELRNFTQQFNTGLKTLLPIIQAAGGDPNKEIPAILQNMGARLEAGKSNGFFNTLAAYIDSALGTQPKDTLGPDGKLRMPPQGDWQTVPGTEGDNPPGRLDFNVPGQTSQQRSQGAENPIRGTPRAGALSYTPQDLDLVTRTILGEAATQGVAGQTAVANVIANRLASGQYGNSASDVVLARHQFEPWTTRRGELMSYSPNSPAYQQAAQIAQAVLEGQSPDNTNGATHFLNAATVRARGTYSNANGLPDWAQGQGQRIGAHTFYRPGSGQASGPQGIAALPVTSDNKPNQLPTGKMDNLSSGMEKFRESANVEDRRNEFSPAQLEEAHKVADAEINKNPNDAKIDIESASKYKRGDAGSIAFVGNHVFYISPGASIESSKSWDYLGTKEQWDETRVSSWVGLADSKKNQSEPFDMSVGREQREAVRAAADRLAKRRRNNPVFSNDMEKALSTGDNSAPKVIPGGLDPESPF